MAVELKSSLMAVNASGELLVVDDDAHDDASSAGPAKTTKHR